MPFNEGEIYSGKIVNSKDFGFFVRLSDRDSGFVKEGLVHIGKIKHGVRLEKPEDSGYRVGDKVYVKLIQVRLDGKLSLSIQDCDQFTGTENLAKRDGRSQIQKQLVQPEKFDAQGRRIGPLTGILLEDTNIKISKRGGLSRARMPSPDMWEMKQLKGGQALHLVSDLNQDKLRRIDGEDSDPEELKEEYAELVLNEDEAPFLRGQTAKAGMCLEPIKISRIPDG